MSTVFLPIDFDSTNESNRNEKLSLAARLALTIGLGRKDLYLAGKELDEDSFHYLMVRYDFLKEEKKRNRERNAANNANKANKQPPNVKRRKRRKRVKRITRAYDRLATIPIDTVFSNMGKTIKVLGHSIPIKSKRYSCYARNGVICVRCGIEGHYFAAEKSVEQPTDKYHLNLYHLGEDGKETMMTVDHRNPLSRGGPDTVSNLQPMCIRCNGLKGNMLDDEFKKIPIVPTV